MADQLDTLLSEERRFPPPPEFAARAIGTPALYDAAARDRLGILGGAGPGARLDDALEECPQLDAPPCPLVRRREAERGSELPRPAPHGAAAQQGGHHLGGGAGRPAGLHLLGAGARSRTRRERPQAARRQEGRPGRDLPADDARSGHRDAGVRARSARCIRSSSVASRPNRCATGSTTRRPRSSSPPTAGTGAGRCSPSSASPMRRWPTAQASSTSWWCAVDRAPRVTSPLPR